MNKNVNNSIIKRLILHFNIDKTIIMRECLSFNNTDYLLREVLSELIWGKIEFKGEEKIFKVIHNELENDPNNIHDKELINYKTFLEDKFKINSEEANNGENDAYNIEVTSKRIKAICEIETLGPGQKFKKHFEDMRKKLRVDEKIQQEYGLKIDTRKLDEKILLEKEEVKFDELEDDKIIKFRRIFKNAYHKIILTFFNTVILMKKQQYDYSIIFRFYGHSDEDIKEFIYEFNSFCDGKHPRYCGNHGDLKRFDGSKGNKDLRIFMERCENLGILIRNEDENQEALILETLDRPDNLEDYRGNIEEFYDDDADNYISPIIMKGRNNIYLSFQEKLSQYLTFVLIDDIAFPKLMLIDPYDYETLQIFFDYDLEKNTNKIDIIDVVTKKKLDFNYCLNKFIINVDPRRVIIEPNYFLNKIELCVNNRNKELESIGLIPIQPTSNAFDYEKEVKKISTDKYLEMTILPLLSSALNIIELIRPSQPLSFIANFLLRNKHTMKNLDDFIKTNIVNDKIDEKINEDEILDLPKENNEDNNI